MKEQNREFPGSLNLTILILLVLLVLNAPVCAATTSLHLVKYADDRTTVILERTVDYQWMEKNLPVKGDGVTHYYLQGPVFNGTTIDKRWDPEEKENVLTKDMGAVKGTDLRDLCDLVGGMSDGDIVRVQATDGFYKDFPYTNVYEPQDAQGPMVVTWFRQDEGYVPRYYSGMRLVFLADTSTNPFGVHAFGNWDEHECFDEKYWYYYYSGTEKYPTTTGLSVQYISDIIIHSQEPPPEPPVAAFSATPLSGEPPLTVSFSDLSTGSPKVWNWTFGDGSASDAQNPSHKYDMQGQFSVTLFASNGAGNSTVTLEDYITVRTATVSFENVGMGEDDQAEENSTIVSPDENATADTTPLTNSAVTPTITLVSTTQQPRQLTPLEILRERSKENGENVTSAPSPVASETTQVTTQITVHVSPVPTPASVPETTQSIAPEVTGTGNPFLDRVIQFIEKLLNMFE